MQVSYNASGTQPMTQFTDIYFFRLFSITGHYRALNILVKKLPCITVESPHTRVMWHFLSVLVAWCGHLYSPPALPPWPRSILYLMTAFLTEVTLPSRSLCHPGACPGRAALSPHICLPRLPWAVHLAAED